MAILCCISPSKQVIEETRSTLKFASRAKLVVMTPKVNEVLDDSAKIKKLEAELAAAKKELEEAKRKAQQQQSESVSQPSSGTESHGVPLRTYVMPQSQTLPQSSRRDTGNAVFRYPNETIDRGAGSKSVDSGQEISGISEVDSFDQPYPGLLDKLQPDSFDFNNTPRKPKRFESSTPTLRTAESTGGPEATYADVSLRLGSDISSPDSLMTGPGPTNRSRIQGSKRGQHRDAPSWDNLDINTIRRDQVGRPLQALQSLMAREGPIPTEITIIASPIDGGEGTCLTDRMEETEARAEFFEMKVEDAEDLIEALFKDLERARLCVHDLVYRNVKLADKLKKKRREDVKDEYQQDEVVLEQYWLLKGSMYVGLFFFITGGYEFFMATIFLIWLILEANLSPIAHN